MDVLDLDALDESSLVFESLAIYDLVERLGIRDYEDLLAAHWTVPDRAYPHERFDPARFVRSAHGALVALPGSAAGDLFDDTARGRATTLLVARRLIDRSTECVQPAAPVAPDRGADLVGWLQRTLGWPLRLLRRLRRGPAH